MRKLCETVGPASSNGNFTRRSRAPEGNMPVGRRMVHFICKLLFLALYGMITVARKHVCPSGLHTVSAVLHRPSLTQHAYHCFLCISAAETPVLCCNHSAWEHHCNATTGSQPVHFHVLYCLSSVHSWRAEIFRPAAWQSVAAEVVEGGPGHQWGGQRPKVQWQRPRRSGAAMQRNRTIPSASRAPRRTARLLGQPWRRTQVCHRRALRRLPRRLVQWGQVRWLPLRLSRCRLCQLPTRQLLHLQLPPRRRQGRSQSSLQPRRPLLRPHLRPQGPMYRSPCLTPWSMTSTSSSERTRGLVGNRQVLQTDVSSGSKTAEPLRVRKTQLVPALSDAAVSLMPTLEPVTNNSVYPYLGPSQDMESSVTPASSTVGCQACWPVRGCSYAKQGLHVAQCASTDASTGRPGCGPSSLHVPLCLADSVGRWPTRSRGHTVLHIPAPLPMFVCYCSGSCCNHPGSCAQLRVCDASPQHTHAARGLTRDGGDRPAELRPACECSSACHLLHIVSGTDNSRHGLAETRAPLLHSSSRDSYSGLGLMQLHGHHIIIHFRCLEVPLLCGVAMPKPVPPVKRFRYKPGKRERQERREQRAAAAQEWAAQQARRVKRPRPVTVFGGPPSSSSRGDVPSLNHGSQIRQTGRRKRRRVLRLSSLRMMPLQWDTLTPSTLTWSHLPALGRMNLRRSQRLWILAWSRRITPDIRLRRLMLRMAQAQLTRVPSMPPLDGSSVKICCSLLQPTTYGQRWWMGEKSYFLDPSGDLRW